MLRDDFNRGTTQIVSEQNPKHHFDGINAAIRLTLTFKVHDKSSRVIFSWTGHRFPPYTGSLKTLLTTYSSFQRCIHCKIILQINDLVNGRLQTLTESFQLHFFPILF